MDFFFGGGEVMLFSGNFHNILVYGIRQFTRLFFGNIYSGTNLVCLKLLFFPISIHTTASSLNINFPAPFL